MSSESLLITSSKKDACWCSEMRSLRSACMGSAVHPRASIGPPLSRLHVPFPSCPTIGRRLQVGKGQGCPAQLPVRRDSVESASCVRCSLLHFHTHTTTLYFLGPALISLSSLNPGRPPPTILFCLPRLEASCHSVVLCLQTYNWRPACIQATSALSYRLQASMQDQAQDHVTRMTFHIDCV